MSKCSLAYASVFVHEVTSDAPPS